jgi:quinol monooxygenase YgiN
VVEDAADPTGNQPSATPARRRAPATVGAMAITSLLDIQVRPDAPADAEARITAVLSATRARPGLISADVVRDLDDPRHLVVLEVWESLEADDAYRTWRATPEGANELRELAGGHVTLKRNEPTSI